MKEIQSHTALRGIAALLVVLYHYRAILPPKYNPDTYSAFLLKGYLWVDCFFMLSGFILCYVYGDRPGRSMSGATKFLRARFARIYPLHFATLIGMAVLLTVVPLFSIIHFDPDWSTFLLNLLVVHAWGFLSAYDWNYPSWSISVEFAAYLAFPLLCIAMRRAFLATVALMLLGILVSLWLGHYQWERLALIHGIPMFCAGMLIFQLPKIERVATLQIVSLLILIAALHFGWHDAVAELCFAALVYSTQSDHGLLGAISRSRPLLALGAWSYSIYMLHIPVYTAYWIVAAIRLGPVLDLIAMLALTLVAGAISYRYFEGPCRDWITGKLRSRRPALQANAPAL